MRDVLVADYLIRNGIICERARRAGRSLDRIERTIIMAGREIAITKGLSSEQITSMEMTGERHFEEVLKPTKVEVVFQHYSEPFEDIPATASYFVTKSNHPSLPEHGNVGADQLIEAGVKVPKTPPYEKWIKTRRVL